VEEMIDFDQAIGKVLDFAQKDGNTLVIITEDHETGGFSVNKGDSKTGMVEGKFTTGSHTGVMIPVFAYGPGSEKFAGIYENNSIFHKMVEAFRFKQ
jgi:alkaline phosphatase